MKKILCLAMCLCASSAHANVTYHYENDIVTGSFTVKTNSPNEINTMNPNDLITWDFTGKDGAQGYNFNFLNTETDTTLKPMGRNDLKVVDFLFSTEIDGSIGLTYLFIENTDHYVLNIHDLFADILNFDDGATLKKGSSGSLSVSQNSPPTVVPLPSAFWLFGSTLIGLMGFKRKKS